MAVNIKVLVLSNKKSKGARNRHVFRNVNVLTTTNVPKNSTRSTKAAYKVELGKNFHTVHDVMYGPPFSPLKI